jgi:phenol 2-monooxygenase
MQIPDEPNAPVTVQIERLDEQHKGQQETVRAKYVVGCDGARSSVRRSLGLEMKGDFHNQAWGVMDALLVTDFPDARIKTVIHSADEGSILIVPREGGYLSRFYIELEKLPNGQRIARDSITAEMLVDRAKRIFNPYTFDVREIPYWSVYEVGQRLTDHFDDVPKIEGELRHPRVFCAGDACHVK